MPAHAFLPVLALTYLAGCTCGCPPGAEAPEQTPIETTSPHIGARWLDVAVAGDAMCAIRKKGGRVHCWGTGPIVDKAPRKGKFKELALADEAGCALDTRGRARCWPREVGGGMKGKRKLHGLVGGWAGFCALTADDTAVCFSPYGESGIEDVPSTRFHALTVGGSFACGIEHQTRRVYCWGKGAALVRPLIGQNRVLAAGSDFVCASDGAGWTRCSGGDHVVGATPRFLFLNDLAAGYGHVCGIQTDGTPHCWPRVDLNRGAP